MGQIANSLDSFFDTLVLHLVKHNGEDYGADKTDSQLQKADYKGVAENLGYGAVGNQRYELLKAHPFALTGEVANTELLESHYKAVDRYVAKHEQQQDSGQDQYLKVPLFQRLQKAALFLLRCFCYLWISQCSSLPLAFLKGKPFLIVGACPPKNRSGLTERSLALPPYTSSSWLDTRRENLSGIMQYNKNKQAYRNLP